MFTAVPLLQLKLLESFESGKTVVLMIELTGRDRSLILPLLLAVATATLVARTIERRSIYDARLTDEEIAARQKARDRPAQ